MDDEALIEELNCIHTGRKDVRGIELRKEVYDSIVQLLLQNKILAQDLTMDPTFQLIKEELGTLQHHEHNREILAMIGLFHERLGSLFNECAITKQEEVKKEIGAPEDKKDTANPAVIIKKEADIVKNQARIFELLEDLVYDKCAKIAQQSTKAWHELELKIAGSKKYFDQEKIRESAYALHTIINQIIQSSLENVKWPLQK